MATNPHSGHRQRMKQQYLEKGASAFQDHQLLELLLFFGVPQGDTNPMAHRLLERFGSIHGVLQATPEQLMDVSGVGEHTATLIHLCGALTRKCGEELRPIGTCLHTSQDLGAYFLPRFFNQPNEVLYLLSMNSRNEVINCTKIAEGSVNATEIHTRKILQQALTDNATCAVIAHSHPAGHALPSQADINATIQLSNMLSSVDIRLVDHIIVADGDFVSMADTAVFRHIFC